MKRLIALIAVTVALLLPLNALACTTVYVGSSLTDDGSTVFGRSEDFSADYNKLMYTAPAGKHTAGEEYAGCYGFTYTFTHDSYGYTAFQDDNVADGICPDCESTHEHTPYQAGGTNSMGLSMTATETLFGTEAVEGADPYTETGIEEAEIPTVLLSECATAREALTLLTSIYDTVGACGGSGIILGDATEQWYIENVTGHQYIAVKLNADIIVLEPNEVSIGLIDLDDTDNVVASEGLIALAQQVGSYVGDAEANTIDFAASYAEFTGSERMAAGLNYLEGIDTFTAETVKASDFTISNVSEAGDIVPAYTAIEPTCAMSVQDVLALYRVAPIAKVRNAETHVFAIYAEDTTETGVIEYVSMDDGRYNVFVPYYPMLTTDTADCYKVAGAHSVVSEQPTEGDFYQTTDREGNTVWIVYPEGWQKSAYWTSDVLSNAMEYGTDDAAKAAVSEAVAALQAELFTDFDAVKAAVASAATLEEKQAAATEGSAAMAMKATETIGALAAQQLG